ncbi:hypothetical protein AJ80_09431 [Polytolypa hystricis UAMH7299]|uniref:Glucanase n=1 Tax=Polytolypa hystricis (strain UAMH7299) TaxID=1447883 RepID=A0A2B7WQV9_POLH7|nr:hypothetical protein AJ80_09431 [Polytolypa hystricis UAMH7299]
MKYAFAAAAALVPAVSAASGAWAQCGGIGFGGDTTCVSGHTCVFSNDWYSQCLPDDQAPPTTTTTSAGGNPSTLTTTTRPAPTNSDNPLAGYEFYANPYYSSEIHSLAIPTFIAAGKTELAAKATGVAEIGTFAWLDVRAKVPDIAGYAADVQAKNAAGANLVMPLVVYDLPDRDCAALASNGELAIDDNGIPLYKEYIDNIATQIKNFPTVPFVLVIEPDSLANMVTNMDVPKCARAADVYKDLTIYAIQKLNLDNVVMYLDAGHAGWLGWPANIEPAAKLFADLYKAAGSPKAVRGLVTNVSNYNAWSSTSCPEYTTPNVNCDEKRFINAFAPLLRAQGFPAYFMMDTSRNGRQPTGQNEWGDWCNVKGTGFGIRPTTSTDDPLVDAFAWVKPGGECDGTSDTSAVRYDGHCGLESALKPAPEAGHWFQAYFEQLLVNANPAF